MSRYLGSNRDYARPAKPADRETRRRWKRGECDAQGNPLPSLDAGRGRILARQECELDPGVMADIRAIELQTRVRQSMEHSDWNVFDRSGQFDPWKR